MPESQNKTPQNSTNYALLVCTAGPLSGKSFDLFTESVVIGRSRDCDIVIREDDQVSRRHAQIQVADGGYLLQDLKSSNGSFVNGERVNRQILKDGDSFRVGRSTFEFVMFASQAGPAKKDATLASALHVEAEGAPGPPAEPVPERPEIEEIGPDAAGEAAGMIKEAGSLEKAGQLAQAAALYDAALTRLALDSPLRMEIDLLRQELDRKLAQQAAAPPAQAEEAADEGDSGIQSMLRQAEELERQQRPTEAISLYHQVMEQVGPEDPLYEELSLILAALESRQAGRDEAALLVSKGQRLESQGDLPGALAAYREALAEAPPGSPLEEELELIIRELEEGKREYRAAEEGVLQRAQALEAEGRWQEAAEIYQEQLAHARDPQWVSRWQTGLARCHEESMLADLFDQGMAAADLQDWTQAREKLSRVVQRRANYERNGRQAAAWLAAAEQQLKPAKKSSATIWSLAGGLAALLVIIILGAGGYSAYRIVSGGKATATAVQEERSRAAGTAAAGTAEAQSGATAAANQTASAQTQTATESPQQTPIPSKETLPPLDLELPHSFLLYAEDFEDPDSGWPRVEDATQDKDYRDGEYLVRVSQGPGLAWAAGSDEVFSDFTLTADLHLVEGADLAGFGLVFRRQDEDNYYRFEIDPVSRYRVSRVVDGELQSLDSEEWVGSSHIQTQGRNNALKVVCSGPLMSLYINDQHAASFEDDSFASGTVGVMVEAAQGAGGVGVAFDNLRLWVSGEAAPPVQPAQAHSSLRYEDDFADPESGWPRGEDEKQSLNFEDGEYLIQVKEGSSPAWAIGSQALFSDVTLETRVAGVEGDGGVQQGILFRHQDDDNFYAFYVTTGGRYGLLQMAAGKMKTVFEYDAPAGLLADDGANNLKIVTEADLLSLYANDTYLRTLRLDGPGEGQLGLYVAAGPESGPAKVAFDDFRVYTAPDSEPAQQATLSTDSTPSTTADAPQAPQRIAFVSRRDGNDEIYSITPDGSGLLRLTNNQGSDIQPAWSPQRDMLAFVSDRDGNPEIYVMQADGGGQTRLTDDPAADFSPAWSPDGTRIAFESDRGSGQEGVTIPGIWVMNADGSDPVKLHEMGREPCWSPDGSRIAAAFQFPGSMNIGIIPSEGGADAQPLLQMGLNTAPAWSPDGSRIAFQNLENEFTEILLINSDGSNLVDLTRTPEMNEFHPSWSPDNSQIVFAREAEDNTDIYLINADGGVPTRLTDNPAWDGYPAWGW